jgi:hypothetical protein
VDRASKSPPARSNIDPINVRSSNDTMNGLS